MTTVIDMSHAFTASLTDASKCVRCKRGFMDHTELAQCECCPNKAKCVLYIDILMCPSCYAKELEAQKDIKDPVKQEERVKAASAHMPTPIAINSVLQSSQQIDQSITLVTDIFNAKTVAIVELKKAIDEDSSIENKPYKLAETLANRVTHLKQVIADSKRQLTEWENEQRATQVYLNQMANTLRAEEREKLKLADINYQPSTPKTPKAKGPAKPKAKKINREELKQWATKVGLTENAIHMVCISNNMNPEAAARHLARLMGKELQ